MTGSTGGECGRVSGGGGGGDGARVNMSHSNLRGDVRGRVRVRGSTVHHHRKMCEMMDVCHLQQSPYHPHQHPHQHPHRAATSQVRRTCPACSGWGNL